MGLEEVKKYIAARDALRKGDRTEALRLLTESIGAEKPTPIMETCVERLLDSNDAALTLVLAEPRKRNG
jgi:hypothetical protein